MRPRDPEGPGFQTESGRHSFVRRRDDNALRGGDVLPGSADILTFSTIPVPIVRIPVPRERITVETDHRCPALERARSERPEPGCAARIIRSGAEIREEEMEEVGRYIAADARRFQGLPGDPGEARQAGRPT